MLDDISLFVHIVRSGGLAAAAVELGLPAATVTRRLQKLEHVLGCRLIHRSARKFSLTSEGEAYFEAYAELVQQFDATTRAMSAELHQISGKLTVLAPTNVSVGILQPMWSAFVRRHPQIRLDLRLGNKLQDIYDGQVDLALRIGPQQDSQLFQRRLGVVSTIVVASREYLAEHGTPDRLSDLSAHRIIAVNGLPRWSMRNKRDGSTEAMRLEATTQVDDIGLARQLARDGLGIALLPASEMVDDLESGRLCRVLTDWQGPDREAFAIWPTGRLLSARAKCLRDFMQAHIGRMPVLQGQVPVCGEPRS
ncbi:LysR family transcriptional regulator [Roseibium polysiphoniae]|uniref:LysR family transcriptional regulator n=1 Tax=Roseibium polysiphoniae TaxID=2571221 RepID=A0ABR9C4M7_9HYPH|nr:LysR family transcriptional regulator [Roseibium polysiphoniae]MBD8874801.1 LysR family transcriptional regulator [Roseibium polysiphoniae]